MTKICRNCKEDKPLELFHNHSLSKDKKQAYCKSCSKGSGNIYRVNNPEKSKEYDKRKYEKAKSRILLKASVDYAKKTKLKIDEMVGKTFSRWTALSVGDRGKKPTLLCECKCGTKRLVRTASLKNGDSQSCGCLQREIVSYTNYQRLPESQAAFRELFRNYKRMAEKRNLTFLLSEEEFFNLTTKNCYYCSCIPKNVKKRTTGDYVYSGIDRVNNNIGYELYNCVSCCIECNVKKGDITINIMEKALGFIKNGA